MHSARHAAHKSTALITGGSTGIGYALAKIFAQERYDLVLVARHQEQLTEASDELTRRYGLSVKTMVKDLSRPTAAEEIIAELHRESIRIDVLVNNAGFALHGFFVETDLATELNMMQVNMVALTQLTKLLVRDMQERGAGKVLNVASTAAFQPGPRMAVYYASKAYVLRFSEALAEELRGSGVTVTALCPGPTRSGFQDRAHLEGTRMVRSPLMMDPETVARSGYRGLMRGGVVVIPGFMNNLLAVLARLTPRALLMRLVGLWHAIR